jgi:hypothetical protein
MKDASEFAMEDTTKDYCVYCARPDGTMQSFEEKQEGLTVFIIKTQRLDRTVAASAAEAMMKKLPAWQGHFTGEGDGRI